MAEARNNFLGSKMNKDLEQRLVPNNEYRNAENVNTSFDVSSMVNGVYFLQIETHEGLSAKKFVVNHE